MGTEDKIRQYENSWTKKCYANGIPDEAPIELEVNNLVPSYRRICRALLRNDIQLKSIGFEAELSEFYGILKRIEIDSRPGIKQLRLFP